MSDYEAEYKHLKEEYRNVERQCITAKAQRTEAEKVAKTVEAEILKLTKLPKFSVEKVEAILDKLDKEIETRLGTLRDKTRQLEGALENVKVGEVPETAPASEQAEEDIDDIFNKL